MTIKVTLNGTDTNPFLQMGFTRNPFPQIARAEYSAVDDALNRLAAEPLKGESDIRAILNPICGGKAGQEFIDECCRRFEKGKVVQFMVHFPER